jgi:pyruvate carboxylase
VAMDAVIANNKVCEAAICYTGDLFNPARAKYDLKYYVEMARELEKAGAHVIGIKDMAGLLKPAAARALVKALKDEVGLPIHLHTHDTSGIGAATLLAAADAGVDAVDAAMDSFSGGTSQPCLGSIVEAMAGTERDTGLDAEAIRALSIYWEKVRQQYAAFEDGLQAPASEVYLHEMPGGQFTNLKAQARSLGLEERWHEIAQAYADANQIFGDIVKVTPSSKVVGDMALMMVAQGLTRKQVEDPAVEVAFPESVADMMRGNLGQPPGGWPEGIVKKVLKGETPSRERPGKHMPSVDIEGERQKLSKELNGRKVDDEDLNGYLMYPKVFLDYMGRHKTYGPVRTLPTPTFFYGMQQGEEISVEIDPGKTLEVRLQAVGETHDDGDVRVFFELNGQSRVIRAHARRGGERRGFNGRQGRRRRFAAHHRGDEDGDGHQGRARGAGEGAACPGGIAGGCEGFADRGGRVIRMPTLPNHQTAQIDIAKLRDYYLSSTHPRGTAQGKIVSCRARHFGERCRMVSGRNAERTCLCQRPTAGVGRVRPTLTGGYRGDARML